MVVTLLEEIIKTMKCGSCDDILMDREATRKSVNTGEYLELCDRCLALSFFGDWQDSVIHVDDGPQIVAELPLLTEGNVPDEPLEI